MTPPCPVLEVRRLRPWHVSIAGDDTPTRIVVGGYAIGGSLATVFAPWCQLQVRLCCLEVSISSRRRPFGSAHTLHGRCRPLKCGASPLRRLPVR